MEILDLRDALEIDKKSSGLVFINEQPQVRSGRKNDFMVGRFYQDGQSIEFKIWEERTYEIVVTKGTGIYQVDVTGSEFNGAYLTVRRIQPYEDDEVTPTDFLSRVPDDAFNKTLEEAQRAIRNCGASDSCFQLIKELTHAPELEGRYWIEAAAIRQHDNVVRGLAFHSFKMLRILAAVLEDNAYLQQHVDLLAVGIVIHDIGKVFEYNMIQISDTWYANHRIRGIEFLAKYKDRIIELYDERFYRQLQAIIAGHHGSYGDRPTTHAAVVVHYIDTLESQVQGLTEDFMNLSGEENKIYHKEWGFLEGF